MKNIRRKWNIGIFGLITAILLMAGSAFSVFAESDGINGSNCKELKVYDVMEDGSVWGTIYTFDRGYYIVHMTSDGVIDRKIEMNSLQIEPHFTGSPILYGIDDRYIVYLTSRGDMEACEAFYNNYNNQYGDYIVVDTMTGEDVTNSIINPEDGQIFLVNKYNNRELRYYVKEYVEDFLGDYCVISIYDETGNCLFKEPFDSGTIFNKYGIEADNQESVYIFRAGEDLYCINDLVYRDEEDTRPNSLIIDLSKEKTTSMYIPSYDHRNSLYFFSSYESCFVAEIFRSHNIVLTIGNLDTGESRVSSENLWGYMRFGKCAMESVEKNSWGETISDTHWVSDINENYLFSLDEYPQPIYSFFPLNKEINVVVFTNGYFTYVNNTGDFLFDPVKGAILAMAEDGRILFRQVEEDEEKEYIIDESGNVSGLTELEKPFFPDYLLARPVSINPGELTIVEDLGNDSTKDAYEAPGVSERDNSTGYGMEGQENAGGGTTLSADNNTLYALFLDKINEYCEMYGEREFVQLTDSLQTQYFKGVCYANTIDFNGDGLYELVLVYLKDDENMQNGSAVATPTGSEDLETFWTDVFEARNYTLEVWAYKDGGISCVYEGTPSSGAGGDTNGTYVGTQLANGETYLITGNAIMWGDDTQSALMYDGNSFVSAPVVPDSSQIFHDYVLAQAYGTVRLSDMWTVTVSNLKLNTQASV